jgi:hypothetical protein
MRLVVASVAGAALALAVAGCNPAQEYRYYSDGIGTDLASPTIVTDSQIQDVYLAALCEQAGLQSGLQFCLPPAVSRDWTLIVQAGLNDIDQRCDAYLAWLDDKRRTKEPILNELHVVSAATQAIMAIAGVGVNPITIVGIAFGLASDTFMNVRSRLLLEVDKSTVETVVINGQNRYRMGLTHVVIDTRVAAVYALRSYLRICTPFTIENQINTTVALFERGAGPIAESNPLIDPAIVRSTIITSPRAPITVVRPIVIQSETRFGKYKQSQAMSPAHISEIQKSLCVKIGGANVVGDLGPRGSDTRVAIGDYLVARGEKRSEIGSSRSVSSGRPFRPDPLARPRNDDGSIAPSTRWSGHELMSRADFSETCSTAPATARHQISDRAVRPG